MEELKSLPIAIQTATANEQHYEVPTEYFLLCLGKHLKYSSCLYPNFDPATPLDVAEEAMLGAAFTPSSPLLNQTHATSISCTVPFTD